MVDFKLLIGIGKKKPCENKNSAPAVGATQQCPPACRGESGCFQQVNVTNDPKKSTEILRSSQAAYEIVSLLGEGTYGKVMKCRQVGSKQFVAVKMLKSTAGFKEAGEKEVQFLSRLRQAQCCDNIVRCYEWFEHCDCTCIVFEMLWRTLEELAAQRRPAPLPLSDARQVLRQVLHALEQLEALGIVHADLKPENIMVAGESATGPLRVKLIDFSCAMAAGRAGGCGGAACAEGCAYAQTRHFRAPEVLLRAGMGAPADVWSLGCVAAGLLLGRTLFPGASEYDQLRFICAAQGAPALEVARRARNAALFFRLEEAAAGGRAALRLKTSYELWQHTGQWPEVNGAQRPLRSLDELERRHVRALQRAGAEHAAPRPDVLHHGVGLIKEMLSLDQVQRIRPVEALAHPFFILPCNIMCQPPEDYGDAQSLPTGATFNTEVASATNFERATQSPASPCGDSTSFVPTSALTKLSETQESPCTALSKGLRATRVEVASRGEADTTKSLPGTELTRNGTYASSETVLMTSQTESRRGTVVSLTNFSNGGQCTTLLPTDSQNAFLGTNIVGGTAIGLSAGIPAESGAVSTVLPKGTGGSLDSGDLRAPVDTRSAQATVLEDMHRWHGAAAIGCAVSSLWARRGRALKDLLRPRRVAVLGSAQ